MVAYLAGGLFSIATGLITRGAEGQTSVVWLPPGIALAVLLVLKRRGLFGIWLGSFVIDAMVSNAEAPTASFTVHATLTLAISGAVVLQAFATAQLVTRFAGQKIVLDRPRSVLAYLLCVACGGLISPTVGSLALVQLAVRNLASLPFDWSSWWISETVGMLLVTPVLLAWFAQPAAIWRPRRLQLGLPLCVALALVATAFVQANRLEGARSRREVASRVDELAVGIRRALDAASDTAEATADFVQANAPDERAEFMAFASRVRARSDSVSAVFWVPRILDAERAGYEQRRAAQGLSEPQIGELGSNHEKVTASRREVYFPVDVLLAQSDVGQLVGLDLGGIPSRRGLLEAAERKDQLVMSPPWDLLGLSADRLGLLLVVPVRGPDRSTLRGFVLCGVRISRLVKESLSSGLASDLEFRIVDRAAPVPQGLVYESKGVAKNGQASHDERRELENGGRHWQLQAQPSADYLAKHRPWAASAVSVIGLLFASLLCGFLLVISGHSANTEQQVAERTLELSHANGQLLEEIETHQRTELALKESELRWQFALEEAGEGVWDWNVSLERLFWSPRLSRVMGYEPSELDDSLRKWTTHVHPDDLGPVRALLQRHLAGETAAFAAELRMRRKDGSWLWFQTRAKVVERDANGRPLRVIGTQTDISERKSSEGEIESHRHRLEELVHERTQELQVAKVAAEDANRAKSLFLANMSHELRTPMHAVLAYARLGLEREPAGRIREFFGHIVDGAERLLRLLNDLLDLSKLEAGKMQITLGRRDLELLVGEVASQLDPLLKSKRIVLEVTRDASCTSCVADVDSCRMAQIFHNILANAVRFSADGDRIAVNFAATTLPAGAGFGSRGPRPALAISISDAGVGIPGGELELIFDSFTQSAKTKTNAGGTGLGLAICRQLVQLHSGNVVARNNPERGATFIVTIPISQNDWSQAA